MFAKIGRVAALLLGGTLVALQIIKAIEENRVFFGSFGGGFLIAVSFA
ncbi:hypothetical protein KSF78_0004310 [Schistosoma japonicum]|nr:hypothetical protein KSF78_0004310 [Schistosoma japonicum]